MIEKDRLIRPLSKIEESLTLINLFYPMTVVCVIRAGQSPETENIRNALGRLQSLNPLLQASILEFHGRYYFMKEESPGAIPFTVIPRKSEDHWSEIVRTELNKGFDQCKSPLMRLHYLNSPDFDSPSECIFSFHHAITDSASIISTTEQFLSDVCNPVQGKDNSAIAKPPANSGSRLLADGVPAGFKGCRMVVRMVPFLFRQITDEIRYRRATGKIRDKAIPGSSENGMLAISFSEKETEELVKWSRKKRLSLNSILTSAMLTAVNNHNYGGKKQLMRTVQFINLRPYLIPPVNDEIPGSYIAMTRISVPVAAGSDITATAAGLNRQMMDSSRRGEKFLYAAMIKLLVRKTLRAVSARLGHTALSYAGVVPLKSSYGPVQINGIHAFITNNRLGAELTAFGKIFSGRLSLDLNYLTAETSRGEAVELADSVKSLLLELKSE